ncbi:MAG: RsmB/NOP family class I SAM-dependent RNA methyltransferase [Candidatus Woesearchaeota archaeon]
MEKGMNVFLERYSQLGQNIIPPIDIRHSLRVNTLKISHQELLRRLKSLGVLLEKIPFTRHGYYYRSRFSLGAITEFFLGYFYLQEAAAQLPVELLDPKPEEIVLDMCAAPGGKTTQIAQLMKNKGVVIALEKQKHRLTSLKSSLERTGVSNTIAYRLDANKVGTLGVEFDKVLLDAPCSGNFVTDRNWFNKKSIEGIQKMVDLQKTLIENALSVLKKGGVLVYSTCSLEPEENELNMEWMLDNFKVIIEKTNLKVGDDGLTNVFGQKLNPYISNCRRFWPNKTKTEGFFIARVRKL